MSLAVSFAVYQLLRPLAASISCVPIAASICCVPLAVCRAYCAALLASCVACLELRVMRCAVCFVRCTLCAMRHAFILLRCAFRAVCNALRVCFILSALLAMYRTSFLLLRACWVLRRVPAEPKGHVACEGDCRQHDQDGIWQVVGADAGRGRHAICVDVERFIRQFADPLISS